MSLEGTPAVSLSTAQYMIIALGVLRYNLSMGVLGLGTWRNTALDYFYPNYCLNG